MKRTFFFLSLLILVSLACDISVSVPISTNPVPLPTDIVIPTPLAPSPIPATVAPDVTQVTIAGEEIVVGPLQFSLLPEIAGGAHGVQVPPTEGGDLPYWEMTPGHTIVELESYFLQDTFHGPQIYIIPAEEYALMVPAAFESMHRLNNIFAKEGAPVLSEELPPVPFFNAQQVFASNIQPISFQNGKGLRFLTQYAQYPAPINNHEMFYLFEGLTNHPDGSYFIVAILPVRHPALAETGDPAAALPSGGIPYPGMSDPNANWPGYYGSVGTLLDTSTPDVFTPNLDHLDFLIQSMQVNK